MKVVLDTNVLIRAAFRRDSDPDSLLRLWDRGSFEIVLSLELLNELGAVLRRPHIRTRLDWSDVDISTFVEELREGASFVDPKTRLNLARDADDNRVLEAAVEGAADFIVSSDEDLLVLGEFEGIEIVTPARFLAILAADAS